MMTVGSVMGPKLVETSQTRTTNAQSEAKIEIARE